MRKLVVLCLAAALAPATLAKVWTTVYRCDEVTPLPAVDPNHPALYRDIMVGTRFAIVISSDRGEQWYGGLMLSLDDAKYASLSGRGCVPSLSGALECIGSCLAAAGKRASASPYSDPWEVGLYFNTNLVSKGPAVPGDWFIVDYRAEQAGTCDVELYDFFASPDVPIQTLSFTQVPSRDFNGDTVVNFKDFALFASHWNSKADPNGPGAASDLNADGRTDLGDLALFSEYWLERTDCGNASQ
jgi:hypothetical protein